MLKHIIFNADLSGEKSVERVSMDENGNPRVTTVEHPAYVDLDYNAKHIGLCGAETFLDEETKKELPQDETRRDAIAGMRDLCESCEAIYLTTDFKTLDKPVKVLVHEIDV